MINQPSYTLRIKAGDTTRQDKEPTRGDGLETWRIEAWEFRKTPAKRSVELLPSEIIAKLQLSSRAARVDTWQRNRNCRPQQGKIQLRQSTAPQSRVLRRVSPADGCHHRLDPHDGEGLGRGGAGEALGAAGPVSPTKRPSALLKQKRHSCLGNSGQIQQEERMADGVSEIL